MKIDITEYFNAGGKSLNGKVQLEQAEAHHNNAPDPDYQAYEQMTTIYVRDNGVDPVEIVSYVDDYDNQIDIRTSWDITNPEADEEEDTCDWEEFSVWTLEQGYDLENLLTAI